MLSPSTLFKALFTGLWFLYAVPRVSAQTDTLITPEEEEDFSMYENLEFADENMRRYCTSKVFDQSPMKLISVGFDVQGPYTLESDTLAGFPASANDIQSSSGLRLSLNVPIISRNDVVIQSNLNYAEQRYAVSSGEGGMHPLADILNTRGLRTTGIGLTVFKPLNERAFLLAQGSADLSGDYGWSAIQPLNTLRYSAAVLYGVKSSDRRMLAFGLSRTYRVGELNYIPVALFNWTAPSRKWGVEMMLPARAHLRYTFNPRNILLVGYELEGQSYRINNHGDYDFGSRKLEIRRGELRPRVVYECSIYNFIWISIQCGYRINWSFDADDLADGEFFRGFFGDQPLAMTNSLSNTVYGLVSINLVSP